MTDTRCTICGYGPEDHDPETGMMPSDIVGCACGSNPICPTFGVPASQCRSTKVHKYHPEVAGGVWPDPAGVL